MAETRAKILFPNLDGRIELCLDRSVLMTLHSQSSTQGRAILLPDSFCDVSVLSNLLVECRHQISARLEDLQVKLVGSAEGVRKALAICRELGVHALATCEREGDKVEVIFHVKTGRLQVAKLPSGANMTSLAPTRISKDQSQGYLAKIKVLIVDDSPTIRKLLREVFSSDAELEVAVANGPSEAEAMILSYRPDVITLDIHMPEMDGVTFLKRYLPKFPIPTIMITSISREEGPKVFEALEAGAVDYIQKPSFQEIRALKDTMIEKVKTAARSKVRMNSQRRTQARPAQGVLDEKSLIAFGSSTGGTEALKEVLIRLPEKIPPIVVVQHIPPIFSNAFAIRLNGLCPFEVKEAAEGDEVRSGRVLIAPGGKQLSLVRDGFVLRASVRTAAPVNRHCPSVDVLFDSVAEILGRRAIGVILTGMGADGAKGMLKMRQAGARTIAQDEASSVVFGMPREAIKLGAAEAIKDLYEIPDLLIEWLIKKKSA